MTRNASAAVEPLLPVELGAGQGSSSRRASRPAAGCSPPALMAQDFVNGIAPDVLAERTPHAGPPKREKEALRIFENLDAVLRAAGTDRSNLVRTDQYYTTVKAVPAYQQVRREFLRGRIPPSTSIAQQGLLLPGADMNIQAHGRHPGGRIRGRRTSSTSSSRAVRPRAIRPRSPSATSSSFPASPRSAIGDEPRRNGVAAAALMARRPQWGGQPIKLETEFIINQRMVRSLALAGATLEDVVHAQVYLDRPRGLFGIQRDVDAALRRSRPDRVDHPLHRARARVRMTARSRSTCIAAKPGSAAAEAPIDAGVATAFRHQPQAVKAGDLLFMPALMAIDRDGLVASAAVDPRQPHFASSPEAQAEAIIDNIARLCEAAGTVARQRGARAAVPHRHRRVLSGLQGLGAPPRRPSVAVLRGRGAGAAAGAGRDGDDGSVGLCAVTAAAALAKIGYCCCNQIALTGG